MFLLSDTPAKLLTNIEFKEFTLSNGLQVILHKDNSNPIVAVNIWYHVGAKDEEKGKTGFAHLFEHMMFQGSENIGKAQHIEYINNAGGIINGTTSQDRTNYFEVVPSNQLELVLWLESDRMNTLKVTQENFDNQREVVKEEKRQRYDNMPYGSRWMEISKRLFRNQPYEWMPIGSMEDLDNARLVYAKEFYKTYYVPNNAILVIAGDINYDETEKLVRKYFEGIKRGEDIKREYGEIKYHQGEIIDTVYDNIKIPAVYISYKIPGIKDRTVIALNILSRILGGGKSSRLYNELVYRKKIAKSVSSFVFENELAGMFIISATAMSDADINQIEQSITSIVEATQSSPVTEDEMEKAKNYIENTFIRSFETVLEKSDNLAYYKTFFGNPSEINHIIERYHSVTPEEIIKASSKYLKRNNRVVLFYLPKEK